MNRKQKNVIFGQGRTRKNANTVKFYYKNRDLEIVDNFKCLDIGILFSKNEKCLQARKAVLSQSTTAVFSDPQ